MPYSITDYLFISNDLFIHNLDTLTFFEILKNIWNKIKTKIIIMNHNLLS